MSITYRLMLIYYNIKYNYLRSNTYRSVRANFLQDLNIQDFQLLRKDFNSASI